VTGLALLVEFLVRREVLIVKKQDQTLKGQKCGDKNDNPLLLPGVRNATSAIRGINAGRNWII